MNRRELFKKAAMAGAAATGALSQARAAANDRIGIGVIGCGGMGRMDLADFQKQPEAEIVAVCDVYQPNLQAAQKLTEGKARTYTDFRKVLDDRAVDAVVVATPDHWHPLIAVAACDAHKDVYVEKPVSNVVREGRLMVEAARRHQRIVQVGLQQRSGTHFQRAAKIVQSGEIGQVHYVQTWIHETSSPEGLGTPPDSAPPEGLDWDFWLGPAPKHPFNIGRFRNGMHRYFADYVDSWLHELGPHIVDLPFWALEPGFPRAVTAAGGRFATDSSADVPDTLDVIWEFDGLIMTWHLMQASSFHFGVGKPGRGRKLGIVFHGTQGTLLANYGLCE